MMLRTLFNFIKVAEYHAEALLWSNQHLIETEASNIRLNKFWHIFSTCLTVEGETDYGEIEAWAIPIVLASVEPFSLTTSARRTSPLSDA